MKPPVENLLKALREAWGGDTSHKPENYSPQNPARGQCVPSSLVIQHYLGGDLIRYSVKGEGIDETHYCNLLSDGTILDVSGSQYKDMNVTLEYSPVDLKGYLDIRSKRLAEKVTKQKYEILLERVAKKLTS